MLCGLILYETVVAGKSHMAKAIGVIVCSGGMKEKIYCSATDEDEKNISFYIIIDRIIHSLKYVFY